MTAKDFSALMQALKSGQWLPVYWLQGEETYFIQSAADYVAKVALPEAEQSFNQSILYGRDTSIEMLLDQLRRLPMMSAYQVVLLKEAQHVRDFEKKILPYLEKPSPTTIFVVQYHDKKLRADSKAAKAINQHGLLFTAEKIREDHLPQWIGDFLKQRGKTIEPAAIQMMVDFIGNDLSVIAHSLDKFEVNEAGNHITPDHIEKYIGISKEFNAFALQKALFTQNTKEAYRIVQYFGRNPKAAPLPLLLGSLYYSFSKLLLLDGARVSNERDVSAVAKVGYYQAGEFLAGSRYYRGERLRKAIHALAVLDRKAKGIGTGSADEKALLMDLLQELLPQ